MVVLRVPEAHHTINPIRSAAQCGARKTWQGKALGITSVQTDRRPSQKTNVSNPPVCAFLQTRVISAKRTLAEPIAHSSGRCCTWSSYWNRSPSCTRRTGRRSRANPTSRWRWSRRSGGCHGCTTAAASTDRTSSLPSILMPRRESSSPRTGTRVLSPTTTPTRPTGTSLSTAPTTEPADAA